jgi:hypothetical protein
MMIEIAKLAFAYVPVEDRLRLDVTGETGRCSLLLTRRLAVRCLKALVRWLETGGGAPASLAAAHARALCQLARGGSATRSERAGPEGISSSAPARITRIEFAQRKQSLKLLIYTVGEAPVAAGTFGRPGVHGLVEQLARKMRQAGWGDVLPVPKWCRAYGEDEPTPHSKATLH